MPDFHDMFGCGAVGWHSVNRWSVGPRVDNSRAQICNFCNIKITWSYSSNLITIRKGNTPISAGLRWRMEHGTLCSGPFVRPRFDFVEHPGERLALIRQAVIGSNRPVFEAAVDKATLFEFFEDSREGCRLGTRRFLKFTESLLTLHMDAMHYDESPLGADLLERFRDRTGL